jgi:hypothetical protein
MNVVAKTYQSKVALTVGGTLEPKYWEDDGQLMYAKMTEYNRGVNGGGGVANRHVYGFGYR